MQSTGCCPNKNHFERSLKDFLPIDLAEAKDERFELQAMVDALLPRGGE
jgi:hypothetical protein